MHRNHPAAWLQPWEKDSSLHSQDKKMWLLVYLQPSLISLRHQYLTLKSASSIINYKKMNSKLKSHNTQQHEEPNCVFHWIPSQILSFGNLKNIHENLLFQSIKDKVSVCAAPYHQYQCQTSSFLTTAASPQLSENSSVHSEGSTQH